MNYQLCSGFLIRLAGFSFQRIEQLRFAATARVAGELEETTRALKDVAARVSTEIDAAWKTFGASGVAADEKAARSRARRVRELLQKLGPELPAEAIADLARLAPALAPGLEELARAHGRRNAAEETLRSTFTAELESKRTRLRELYARDERLREAVFLESPSAHAGLEWFLAETGPRNARSRVRERTAIKYLQRFCAKNDTNSICGPMGVAFSTDTPADEDGRGPAVTLVDETRHRKTHIAYWAADLLLQALSGKYGGDAGIILRRNPVLTSRDGQVEWCTLAHDAMRYFKRTYRRAEESEELALILQLLDGRSMTMEQVIATLGEQHELAEEESRGLLAQLCDAGILLAQPVIPVGTIDPLAHVTAHVKSWPEGEPQRTALQELATVGTCIEQFDGAGLAGRVEVSKRLATEFERITSSASSRGQGEHYVDRSVLHEDCHAALAVDLGDRRGLASLERAVALLVAAAALPVELRRENVRHWFRGRFAGRTRVSALEVHRAFDDETPYERDATTDAATELRRRIALVQQVIREAVAAQDRGVAELSAPALAAAVDGAPGSARASYASVDVMIARRPTGPMWIIGEMHGFCMLPTGRLNVAPAEVRNRLLEEMRGIVARLGGRRQTAEPLFLHTQATDRRFPLAARDLLVIGAGERKQGIELGRLEMSLAGDSFQYFDGDVELAPLTPYWAYPFFTYTSPVAPLIDEFLDRFFPLALLPAELVDRDLPRLSIEGVAFRRRTWVRTAAELQAQLGHTQEHELLARTRGLRTELGCGREVFASVPGEPKPVLLDLENYFLADAFFQLLKGAAPDARVKLSEMLPAPSDLLLRAEDGLRTFELRMGIYRLGAD